MLKVQLGPMETTLLLYDNQDQDLLQEKIINLEKLTLKNKLLEKRVTKTMFLLKRLKKDELELQITNQ
jgi:hypothetical protein